MQEVISAEVNAKTGKAKVEQYKWLMTGKPGDLLWLAKTMLEIDHNYQRNACKRDGPGEPHQCQSAVARLADRHSGRGLEHRGLMNWEPSSVQAGDG